MRDGQRVWAVTGQKGRVETYGVWGKRHPQQYVRMDGRLKAWPVPGWASAWTWQAGASR